MEEKLNGIQQLSMAILILAICGAKIVFYTELAFNIMNGGSID